MNYFFVFQNKTYDLERRGGYLWAPLHSKNGRRVSHHERMKEIKHGDIIIHSYRQAIKAVSIAKTDAYEATRPKELPPRWCETGWRVDSEYIVFEKTIHFSEYKNELIKLQPEKGGPLKKTGDGIGNGVEGYLFEANKEMFEFLLDKIADVQSAEFEKWRVYDLLNFKIEDKQDLTEIEIEMQIEGVQARHHSIEQLAKLINVNPVQKKSQKKESTVYYRSPFIKEMVKQIADGKCQMCGEDAPFKDRSNGPYLEGHHVKRLADGGSDTVDNVVAICPNCHRKMHVLNDPNDVLILEGVAHNNDAIMKRMLFYQSNIGNDEHENN